MDLKIILLTSVMNLVYFSGVDGRCTEIYQKKRIEECENILQLTHANINIKLSNPGLAWTQDDLLKTCKHKSNLERCYELVMLQCPNMKDSIYQKFLYIHYNFNYLCNGLLESYIDNLPCLSRINTASVKNNCMKENSYSPNNCSKISVVASCVSHRINNNCGSTAANLIQVLLQNELLSLVEAPENCEFDSKEEHCTLKRLESKSRLYASQIGFTNTQLKKLQVDPIPKLNSYQLEHLCTNLPLFKKNVSYVGVQCRNTYREYLISQIYYIKIFTIICNDKKNFLRFNYCLTYPALAKDRKNRFFSGRMEMISYQESDTQICITLANTIIRDLRATQHFCSKDHLSWLSSFYVQGLSSTYTELNCEQPILSSTTIYPNSHQTAQLIPSKFGFIMAIIGSIFFIILVLAATYMFMQKKKQKEIEDSPPTSSTNIVTRPNFVTQGHFSPPSYSSAPPTYDEVMASEYRR